MTSETTRPMTAPTPPESDRDTSVEELVAELFEVCAELSRRTGRPVSPDGHLVGSLGEVFAAERLGLRLMPPSNQGYDAVGPDGEFVEIKTTTRAAVNISNEGTLADRFVIVKLSPTGGPVVAFDGPTELVLAAAGPPQKNGQRRVGVSRLLAMMSPP